MKKDKTDSVVCTHMVYKTLCMSKLKWSIEHVK